MITIWKEASFYYSRRTEKREGHCIYYYGLFLFDRDGIEQNHEESIEWIIKARNKYVIEADYLLCRLLRFGVIQVVKENLAYYPFWSRRSQSKSNGRLFINYFQYAFDNERGIGGRRVDYEVAQRYYLKEVLTQGAWSDMN